MKSRISALRVIGIAEGISFLVLLFIAMPLKYFAAMPLAVKYAGWAHGLLFILFLIAVVLAIGPMRWNFWGVARAVIASLLPGGTFFLDRSLKKREAMIDEERID